MISNIGYEEEDLLIDLVVNICHSDAWAVSSNSTGSLLSANITQETTGKIRLPTHPGCECSAILLCQFSDDIWEVVRYDNWAIVSV